MQFTREYIYLPIMHREKHEDIVYKAFSKDCSDELSDVEERYRRTRMYSSTY